MYKRQKLATPKDLIQLSDKLATDLIKVSDKLATPKDLIQLSDKLATGSIKVSDKLATPEDLIQLSDKLATDSIQVSDKLDMRLKHRSTHTHTYIHHNYQTNCASTVNIIYQASHEPNKYKQLLKLLHFTKYSMFIWQDIRSNSDPSTTHISDHIINIYIRNFKNLLDIFPFVGVGHWDGFTVRLQLPL